MASGILYVGVKAHVLAIDQATGTTLWETKLKGGSVLSGDRFVTLLVDGNRVYAHTYGEIFCLDAQTGAERWTNPLTGLSYDVASLAVDGQTSASGAAQAYRREQRSANAAAAAGQA